MEKSNFKLFVGIDIQKKLWSVSIYTSEGHQTTFQLPPIPQLLKKYIDEKFEDAKVICAYRATLYSSWIHRLLTSYNYQCIAFDPGAVTGFSNRTNESHLTIDSRTIGNALRNGLIESIFPQQNDEGSIFPLSLNTK
jgi:hypothetical protein